MRPFAFAAVMIAFTAARAAADPPELATWMVNISGATGYNGLHANVDSVQYSATNVYVRCSGIPSYDVGPWNDGNPNVPSAQAYLFRIPRSPQVNASTKTATPLGAIGAWINGVPVFNPLDARSFNNQNVWHQNAVVVEGPGMDACLGHPAPGGRYHHHQRPRCLFTDDSTAHSPLLGYAFDGFPIYGPRGFTNPDGSGGVARMRSSYRLRNITQRHELPDGTVLSPSQWGPDVSGTYPLGTYIEDYEYVSGLGDLDEYNGRVVVTPDYPAGTYAYHATLDASGNSAYPYALGPKYYGVVATDNIPGGHVTISEPVTTYWNPLLGVPAPTPLGAFRFGPSQPNPATSHIVLTFVIPEASRVDIEVYDAMGKLVRRVFEGWLERGVHHRAWDGGDSSGSRVCPGVYWARGRARNMAASERIVVIR